MRGRSELDIASPTSLWIFVLGNASTNHRFPFSVNCLPYLGHSWRIFEVFSFQFFSFPPPTTLGASLANLRHIDPRRRVGCSRRRSTHYRCHPRRRLRVYVVCRSHERVVLEYAIEVRFAATRKNTSSRRFDRRRVLDHNLPLIRPDRHAEGSLPALRAMRMLMALRVKTAKPARHPLQS